MKAEHNPLTAPQPIERLECLRVLAPLMILGFLSSRFIHVEHWLTDVGFVVPEIGGDDYRQPLFIPAIPVALAYGAAAVTIVSGLMTSLGKKTRLASGLFAGLLAYLALADRLEAFTVNKLGTVVAIGLFASPAGARFSLDARGEPNPSQPLTHVTWGNVRFFQALLVFMYMASGIAKLRGGWLDNPHVIWSHLHDSYQTDFTYFMARRVPPFAWTLFQYATLVYEVGAPLWFGMKKTRLPALFVGLGMHLSIGLMFGPVIWFSLLMISLLVACFAPVDWLTWSLSRIAREPLAPATRVT